MLKMLSTVAVAAATSFVSLPAAAEFMDFEVTEGSVPGNVANTFWADKLNGNYAEMVSITGANTFSAQAYANFGQFAKNEGSTIVTPVQLNGLNGYGLYALFNATGTFAGTSFTGGTGAFYLYIDPNQDTTFALTNGLVAPTVGGNADDYLIAWTTTLTSGSGNLGGPPGAFDFKFTDFQLTTGDQSAFWAGNQAGDQYFTSPSPFYFQTQVNGDIDQFQGTNPISVTGDVSAVFVPEPGTLALAGLALGAMGLVSRRRRSS